MSKETIDDLRDAPDGYGRGNFKFLEIHSGSRLK
jgi:hypothetical protein